MPTRRRVATRKTEQPAFPHPEDDKSWDAMTSGEILYAAYGPARAGLDIVDMQAVSGLPPLEVPPCLTRQQWFDIMNNGQ